MFLCFFEFLGPSVHYRNYWGDKGTSKGKRKKKLNPMNQLFLTLIKLKQNPKERDLALRFGISVSTVSKKLHYLGILSVFSSQRGQLDARC